jgi:hypothetical protein
MTEYAHRPAFIHEGNSGDDGAEYLRDMNMAILEAQSSLI